MCFNCLFRLTTNLSVDILYLSKILPSLRLKLIDDSECKKNESLHIFIQSYLSSRSKPSGVEDVLRDGSDIVAEGSEYRIDSSEKNLTILDRQVSFVCKIVCLSTNLYVDLF